MEITADIKKETIYRYETEHGIGEEECLVYYDSDFDLYGLNENVTEEDVNRCYEAITGNAAEEYYETGSGDGDSDIFGGIDVEKVKKFDINDIFDTPSDNVKQKKNVSESDTPETEKMQVRITGLKIRIKDNGSIDEASYGTDNIKSAAADLYNMPGDRKLLLCYSHNGTESEREIIFVDAQDNTGYVERPGNIPELDNKISVIQTAVLSEFIKLQKADYGNLIKDGGYEDKLKKARERKLSGRKYVRQKRGTLENVFNRVSFSGYDLSATDFSGNTFIECEFDGTDFTACNFVDAVFIGCSPENAVLKDAVFADNVFYILK